MHKFHLGLVVRYHTSFILNEIPNQGIISFNNVLVTSLALLVQQGKTSGYLENVSAKTNRYQYPSCQGNSEKSICL